MSIMSIKHLACAVLAMMIILIAATTGTAVAHELQHAAHHTAGMHGTGLCAWMCATVAAESTTAAHNFQLLSIIERLSLRSDRAVVAPLLSFGFPRAPPISISIPAD
jgi:hypothetical protein